MNTIKIALVVSLLAIAGSSYATTIDYRHEIQDRVGNTHRDRLLVSHRFANGFGLSLEGKWRGGTNKDKAYNETVSNGTEVVLSYIYKFNPQFQLEPGFSLESGSSYNNYRPYLRGKYYFTSDFNASLRLRPYFKRYTGNIGTGKNTTENGYNVTGVLSYQVLSDVNISYELDYKKATTDGAILTDNGNQEWTHTVTTSYMYNRNWTPYFSISNVAGYKYSDERQTRFRVGFKYNF